MAFNSTTSTPVSCQTPAELQQEIDRVAKVAKRNPLLAVSQALKRPRLSSALQRVEGVISGIDPGELRKRCLSPCLLA